MPPTYFPLRWESTGDQWWYASPIDWAAANGHYDIVRELLHHDTNLLIKLTSLRRIRRLETVWDDEHESQFDNVAKCRSHVAQKLFLDCETKKKGHNHNSLIRAGYGGWLLYTAASAGDVSFINKLLEIDPLLVFGEGEYGVTDILYAAARSKNHEVFRLLLDFCVLPPPRRCYSGETEDHQSGGTPSSNPFKWEMMNRAVHATARGGNLKMLKELIGEKCTDVLPYRDVQGSTILHTAAGRGQVEVVKDLLASFDITTSTDNQGNTALHVAAYRGFLAVVEVLILASPSSTSLTNNFGDTFLHMTVAGFRTPGFRRLDRQIELMKQLVCGKIVNLQDIINVGNNEGRTALHMAVIENIQSDLVELLMTIPSIDLNIRDDDGMTPLDLLKQRPRSASSEILIKCLISAGGISNNCEALLARNALVSNLKMQGIGSSPGTSFRIPDAEIFLYTGADNASSDASCCTPAIAEEFDSCSSEIGQYSLHSNGKRPSSVNHAAKRLMILLRWPRRKKDRKADNTVSEDDDDDSKKSYDRISRKHWGSDPVPLRQRFSELSSLSNNKRTLSVNMSLPSPSIKRKFAAGLMHGVIQTMPSLTRSSPSSPFSGSTMSSPTSTDKQKGLYVGKNSAKLSRLFQSFGNETPEMNHRSSSFNKRLMNQYLCFGAQTLAVEEDSLSCGRESHSYSPSHSVL